MRMTQLFSQSWSFSPAFIARSVCLSPSMTVSFCSVELWFVSVIAEAADGGRMSEPATRSLQKSRMDTYSRVGRTVVAAMLTGKTGKRGRGSLPPFSRADCPYFLPFLAPAFSPDFPAGLGLLLSAWLQVSLPFSTPMRERQTRLARQRVCEQRGFYATKIYWDFTWNL